MDELDYDFGWIKDPETGKFIECSTYPNSTFED